MSTKMRFHLDIDRRNLSDQVLLEDIGAVAKQLNVDSPTTEQYRKHGRFHPSTIIRRFDGWPNALSRAKLAVVHHNGGVSEADALADLQRVAALLERSTLTYREYRKHGRFSSVPFARLFGSWNAALLKAGLELSKRSLIPDEELFENLQDMWCALGRQPKYGEVGKPFSRFAAGTYEGRFGSWRKALEAFVAYANSNEPLLDSSPKISSGSAAYAETKTSRRRRATSRKPNWRLRFLVMQGDGFRCRACGASPATTPGVKLQVDHRTPWSEGGETVFDNLQTLCEPCNVGKSNVCAGPDEFQSNDDFQRS